MNPPPQKKTKNKKKQQEQQTLKQLTFKYKITKIVLVTSFKTHISNPKHTVLDLFTVCSNHAPLNYIGQETKNNLQFMSLTYLWLWNSQSHQTWYELLDPEQGYNHAKFEGPPININSVHQNANV